ncbi:GGDEF domain-containing protein [Oleiagrimonas soli]|uniref:diguanylate cyclase n=1 Tax=Oleiagrimonas soli TaxID=1543381 RepID=A0A841KTY2_9GAMM|nr:GGDEF domain-containing protein [Oleiagrimonas soli]MBB6185404.1 diguanylate cyclase (GGDEF)-like protein [Oleiagrimonas soli]
MTGLSSRALTYRYLIALGLIAVCTVFSHLILGRVLREDDGSAAVAAMSTRQVVLAERIAEMADEYADGSAQAHAVLHVSLAQFEKEYRLLSSDEGSASFMAYGKPRALALYRDGLGQDIERFIALAKRIDTGAPGDPQFVGALDALRSLAREQLPDGLDAVATVHVKAGEVHLQRMEMLQHAILAIVLLVLLFEALGIFRPMIRRIVRYARQLQDLATRDVLTGLCNRREFQDRVAAVREAPVSTSEVAVLMLDVDHFKSINDRYGHAVGDIVLTRLGAHLQGILRGGDIAGRIGGEEFALALPATSRDGALKMAERLRVEVAAMAPPDEAPDLKVTVSIGVAALGPGAEATLDEALRMADGALYRAKRNGRNRIECADASDAVATARTGG